MLGSSDVLPWRPVSRAFDSGAAFAVQERLHRPIDGLPPKFPLNIAGYALLAAMALVLRAGG
jgi:hypothetical protein